MSEHSRAPYYSSSSDGAMSTHSSSTGNVMDFEYPTEVFSSDCSYTRSTVEAALILVAPTIQGNTATSTTRSDDLVAPVICRSVKFNWKKLSDCLPHIDIRSIPRYKRHMFGNQGIARPRSSLRSRVRSIPVAHRTRSRRGLPVSSSLAS